MSDFAASWSLSRKRLVDEISELSKEQLNWRLHPDCLTIGEMAIHVAGVEVLFASQLTGASLDENTSRLKMAATEGVIDGAAFPFSPEEITPSLVADCMEIGVSHVQPLMQDASLETRQKEIKSALGPMISGEGALARLGFHSAYHQGQAYLIKTAPGFPAS